MPDELPPDVSGIPADLRDALCWWYRAHQPGGNSKRDRADALLYAALEPLIDGLRETFCARRLPFDITATVAEAEDAASRGDQPTDH